MDDSKAEDSNANAPLPPGGQRKRPAPTIDLPASEVTDTTPKAESAQGDAAPKTPRSGWRARCIDDTGDNGGISVVRLPR